MLREKHTKNVYPISEKSSNYALTTEKSEAKKYQTRVIPKRLLSLYDKAPQP
jgi:hypothetical protein